MPCCSQVRHQREPDSCRRFPVRCDRGGLRNMRLASSNNSQSCVWCKQTSNTDEASVCQAVARLGPPKQSRESDVDERSDESFPIVKIHFIARMDREQPVPGRAVQARTSAPARHWAPQQPSLYPGDQLLDRRPPRVTAQARRLPHHLKP